MELTAVAVSMPLGMVFLLSGIIVNIIQVACFLIIRPLSKTTYRRVIGVATEILWLHIIWVMEWWAGLKVQLHTDLKTYQLMGKEHALIMPNHICDADVLMMWLLAEHSGCLRSALLVMKKSAKHLPIFGWACWFFECVFLDRSWAKDENKLKSSFQGLKDFARPFWLNIFLEGTRMTPDKLLAAQEFAVSKGLPVPKNVLIPRTKGFISAIKHMRSFVPAVYDVTLAIPKGYPLPSVMRLLKGQQCVVHVHIKRYLMKDLPESDEGISQWCRDRFVAKDAMLDKFQVKGTFEGKEITDFRRSKKSLFVVTSLATIYCMGAIMLIQRFSLLSTWKGITSVTATLAFDAILLHVIIEFTQLRKK